MLTNNFQCEEGNRSGLLLRKRQNVTAEEKVSIHSVVFREKKTNKGIIKLHTFNILVCSDTLNDLQCVFHYISTKP